jgi:alanine dehydrogenase
MQRFRLLTEEDVKGLLPADELIQAMEGALARFSAGEVQQPVRTVLSVGAQKAYYGVMPAVIADPPAMGAKLVTVFNGNLAKGLPSHLATILLFDPDTGALAAVLDGRYITEARTAAVSAVSTKALARRDATRLALIGSGVQARSHLEALRLVRPLTEARVWSPQASSRQRFVADSAAHGIPVRACDTAQAAVDGADIVVLVTASPVPVVEDDWIAPGTHVICVGACRPDQREMPPELVARGRLIVDSRAAALVEAGDVVQGIREGRFDASHVAGELGEVLLGRVEGRRSRDEVTIFKSLGMAVEDVAAADLVYRRAEDVGAGTATAL